MLLIFSLKSLQFPEHRNIYICIYNGLNFMHLKFAGCIQYCIPII